MWLLPHFARLSGFIIRLYYRASRSGAPVPPRGPVLVVANHPNTLLDPIFVAWAAGRPMRFLAKAPLFRIPVLGWLVRGSGALPVYRRQDDPALTEKNEDTFLAVHDALAKGSAVALFPEGISHSQPELAPLRTGAARIALGAAARVGSAIAIIPVGLVFRHKDRFRSEAHAVVGDAIAWDDLAARGASDREAVAQLTARIERAMRAITLNLARWEDERVVRAAEAIWAAAQGADTSPGERIDRLHTAADVLARARASGDPRWSALARDVTVHARFLSILGLRARDLEDREARRTAPLAGGRLTLVGLGELLLATVATLLFWIPYRLTGLLAAAIARDRESLSTMRVLGGALIFLAWIAVLAGAAAIWRGWPAALATLAFAPALAVAGLYAAEHWRWTLIGARQWVTAHGSDPRIAALRARQRDLARRLDEALASVPPEPSSARG